MEIVKYQHHGILMNVRKDLKGRHREHCLCFFCKFFDMDNREENCPIANVLYSLNILANIVTPVWECKKFDPIEDEE